MARLQILELPMVHNGDATETPFILVIDQAGTDTTKYIADWPDDIAQRLGARHVLCFPSTIDIPANNLTISTPPAATELVIDGDTVKVAEE